MEGVFPSVFSRFIRQGGAVVVEPPEKDLWDKENGPGGKRGPSALRT